MNPAIIVNSFQALVLSMVLVQPTDCHLPRPTNTDTCQPCGDITSRVPVTARYSSRSLRNNSCRIDAKLNHLKIEYGFQEYDINTLANECCSNINLPTESIPVDIPSAHNVITDIIVLLKDVNLLNYTNLSRGCLARLNQTLCHLHRLSSETPSQRITFSNCRRTSYLQTCRNTRDCKLKMTMVLLTTASKLMHNLQNSTSNGFWGNT